MIRLAITAGCLLATTSIAPAGPVVFFADDAEGVFRFDVNARLLLPLTPTSAGYESDIAVDHVRGRVYWADGVGHAIWSNSVNGGTPDLIVGPTSDAGVPVGVEVDLDTGDIFWTEAQTRLFKVRPHGTSQTWIAFSAEKIIDADPGEIEFFGGNFYWTNGAIDRGVYENAERIVQSDAIGLDFSESAGLFWSTSSAIYRSGSDGQGQAPVIVLGPGQAHSIGKIAVDPIGDSVYWTQFDFQENNRASLWRARLDGSNAEMILGGLFQPTAIAVSPIPEAPTAGIALLAILFWSNVTRLPRFAHRPNWSLH